MAPKIEADQGVGLEEALQTGRPRPKVAREGGLRRWGSYGTADDANRCRGRKTTEPIGSRTGHRISSHERLILR